MVLPVLGFVAGCLCFGFVGLVLLSRDERISGRNLLVFVASAMVSAIVIGAMCSLTAGKITEEPLHSAISLVSVVLALVGGAAGGLVGVSMASRIAGH